MGYVICEKCGGYYELQPGEHPEDFDKCDCGGKLRYERSIVEDHDPYSSASGFKLSFPSKSLKTLGAGIVVALVLLIKFLPKLFIIFWALVPFRTFAEYGIPYQYLIPVLAIIAFIAARILGPRRR